MNKKKVFISGPMTGIPNCNKDEFEKADRLFTSLGCYVFNPYRIYEMFGDSLTNDEYESIDISALAVCDTIYMLNGWENSTGANIEYKYAIEHKMDILDENELMWRIWDAI